MTNFFINRSFKVWPFETDQYCIFNENQTINFKTHSFKYLNYSIFIDKIWKSK